MKGYFFLLGIRLDALNISAAVSRIEGWLAPGSKKKTSYVCISNVNNVVEAQKNPLFKRIQNEADLSVCDGMPLVWSARLRGLKLNERVYGLALMQQMLRGGEEKGYRNYFYGSTEEVLKAMVSKIRSQYPKLEICGFYSPAFRPLTEAEKESIVKDINNSGADIVWVGLGCPKQEIWMYEFKDRLSCPVLIGVGAAFDFFAGTKKQAPVFIQKSGFEWLFRLCSEPKRLWRRYLINNSIFIILLLKELICSVFTFPISLRSKAIPSRK